MEEHAIFSATLASSAAPVRTFLIIVAAGLILYAVMVAAVLWKLHRWGRDMEERAALWERTHQEYMISLKIDAWRRQEEHARWMKGLDARRR